MRKLFCVLLSLSLFSCSSGTGSGAPDASDAADAADTSDTSDSGADGADPIETADDGQAPTDVDLGDDFGFFVPAGASACSRDAVTPESFSLVPQRTGRIMFKPGLHRLGRNTDKFEADLIEAVQVTVQGIQATPTAKGSFVRTSIPGADGERIQYDYSQTFQAGADRYDLLLRLSYDVKGGQPVQQVIKFDDSLFFREDFRLELTSADGFPMQYGTCTFTIYRCAIHNFEFQNSARLELEVCTYCPPDWMCKSSLAGLRRAELEHQAEKRTSDDHLKLAATMRHHNWGSDFLVLFSPPVGDYHGLYLGSENYPDHGTFKAGKYLGADYQPILTVPVTKYEVR